MDQFVDDGVFSEKDVNLNTSVTPIRTRNPARDYSIGSDASL